jgi:hypothetical protein
MNEIQARLKQSRYKPIYGGGEVPQMWVKLGRDGDFLYGRGAVVFPGGRHVVTIGAAVHVSEVTMEAMAIVAGEMEIPLSDLQYEVAGRRGKRKRGGLRAALKRMGTKFRARVNKIAKKLAKGKIMNKLRSGYAKLLDSPIAKTGFRMLANAMQVWGIPAPLARAIVEHHRKIKVERLKAGGWAGRIARATEKGVRRGEFFREGARMHAKALPGTLAAMIPGGNIAKAIGKFTKGKKMPPRLAKLLKKMNVKIPGMDVAGELDYDQVNGYTRRGDYLGGYACDGYGV